MPLATCHIPHAACRMRLRRLIWPTARCVRPKRAAYFNFICLRQRNQSAFSPTLATPTCLRLKCATKEEEKKKKLWRPFVAVPAVRDLRHCQLDARFPFFPFLSLPLPSFRSPHASYSHSLSSSRSSSTVSFFSLRFRQFSVLSCKMFSWPVALAVFGHT